VLFNGHVATGVEWIKDGHRSSAAAHSEVILSAGALQSPQLLQLSGVGPAELLRQAGIPVVADAPEVGAGLQDHYQARIIVRLKRPISLNDQVRNPYQLAKMGAEWLFAGRGPLTVGAGQVGGAACTEYAVNGRPDVQFNVMPLSVDKPGDPLHRYSGFTASVCQCHATSRGQLAIRSADPFDQPRITPNYFAEEIDRKTIISGMRILRDIFQQKSFRGLWISKWCLARWLTARTRSGILHARLAAPCFIAWALAGWGATTAPCSIRAYGFAALIGCGSSTLP